VRLVLDDVTAELRDVTAKREALDESVVELRALLELQTEAESGKAKQNERRERDLERLRQDVEAEKRQRVRAEELVQQLRADSVARDERSLQTDLLMQVVFRAPQTATH